MNDELIVKIDNLLRDINKSVNSYTKNKLNMHGLTLARFRTLWMISHLAPVNMNQLHKEMHLANSTLTVIVDHLVKEKLVKRYRSSKDRRVVLLETTSKGIECLNKVLEVRRNFLKEGLKELNHKQQKQLINLLNIINTKIQESNN